MRIVTRRTHKDWQSAVRAQNAKVADAMIHNHKMGMHALEAARYAKRGCPLCQENYDPHGPTEANR